MKDTSEIFTSSTFASEEIEVLLDCLNDTYEVIKEAAYKILMILPVDCLALTVKLSFIEL